MASIESGTLPYAIELENGSLDHSPLPTKSMLVTFPSKYAEAFEFLKDTFPSPSKCMNLSYSNDKIDFSRHDFQKAGLSSDVIKNVIAAIQEIFITIEAEDVEISEKVPINISFQKEIITFEADLEAHFEDFPKD